MNQCGIMRASSRRPCSSRNVCADRGGYLQQVRVISLSRLRQVWKIEHFCQAHASSCNPLAVDSCFHILVNNAQGQNKPCQISKPSCLATVLDTVHCILSASHDLRWMHSILWEIAHAISNLGATFVTLAHDKPAEYQNQMI